MYLDTDSMCEMWDAFLSTLDEEPFPDADFSPLEMGEMVAEWFFEWHETMHPDTTRRAIGVDFDGVLHRYDTPIGLDEQDCCLDPPVDGAREWVEEVLEHFDIIVYTCRHVSPGGLESVREWLDKWGFPDLPVTGVKPVARLYVDDRGMTFTGRNFPSIEYLKGFQPWNRVESTEMWMDIDEYEGYYQVSSLGRVRGLDREANDGRKVRGKLLKLQSGSNNYLQVTLTKNGEQKIYSVARLVATAFIANPLEKPEVNHINGDKTNNLMTNLEWCTSRENSQHRYDSGLQGDLPIMRGEDNPSSKLTVDDVITIKQRLHTDDERGVMSELAREYGVTPATIRNIKTNKTWAHIGTKWGRE